MSLLKRIIKSRYILWSLIRQDLRNRYRNSIIGIGWTLLTPLGLVTIIGIVYSQVLGQPIKEFIPYLFSGLIPWLYIVQCADGGTTAFISAEGYIKQTQTPIEIFPIRVASGSFITLINSLLVYIVVFMILSIDKFNFSMLLVIPALIIWLVLGIALSTMAAIINTYFRDYAPLQSLMMQGFFYATPIMFPAEFLNKKSFKWIYEWNPVYYFIEIIRRPLQGQTVEGYKWIIAICIALGLISFSFILIARIGRKITFRL